MSKDYELRINFVQSTKDDADNQTLIVEKSEDPVIHVTKTKVFSKHLTAAADAITQELCDMYLAGMGDSGKKPAKR